MLYDTWEATNKQDILNQINKRHTLYLYSSYGKGKTHFLKYVENRFKGRYTIYRLSASLHQELIDEIRLNKATGEMKKSIVTKMKECEVLLLDDLGNENMSEFVHEALSIIIDYRYMQHNLDKPIRTLITSNYTLNALYENWIDKIGKVKAGQLVSRIRKFGAIELISKNWRQL